MHHSSDLRALRLDGRTPDQLRPVSIEHGAQKMPDGSASIRCGDTWVVCAASVDERIPTWLAGKGKGWVTAEYAMIPSATPGRGTREGWRGQGPSGRTLEIGRLIGRALRAAIDLEKLGERTVTVDCDVVQADGGNRTASVTGGFVALALALEKLRGDGHVAAGVIRDTVCAVSVGVLAGGAVVLDMPYQEDSRAEVDLNIVSTGTGRIVEVQCTAEGPPFAPELLDEMVALGRRGNAELTSIQRRVLAAAGVDIKRLIAAPESR